MLEIICDKICQAFIDIKYEENENVGIYILYDKIVKNYLENVFFIYI